MIYGYEEVFICQQKIISFDLFSSSKNNKLRFIDEEKTKELQKDWKGYGKSQVLFGIVVFVIFVLSALYYYIL